MWGSAVAIFFAMFSNRNRLFLLFGIAYGWLVRDYFFEGDHAEG